MSPSLTESIRICPLQALLNRTAALRPYTLGNPKAWLGIAYHEVLEKLWSNERPDFDDEQWVDFLWKRAVDQISNVAHSHPLNRRFADCETWSGYHLTHAMIRVRAREALTEQPRSREPSTPTGTGGGPAREQTLYAMDRKLKGQPDVVVGDEIRDYKSGKVMEELPDGSIRVKEGYVRQLRLYGHLVRENTGVCPSKGKLLPMQGAQVEINLTPDECEAEAKEAIGLLDSLNLAISNCGAAEQIASASEESCYWCSHKMYCDAFWGNVVEGWWSDSKSAAITGSLAEAPIKIHGGKSISLTIDASAGNVPLDQFVIGPFDRDIHHNVESFSVGDSIRIVGCYRRQDGTLTTTPWTVCCSQAEWPEILATSSTKK